MKTIVIGLGNPILGDDGVGWRVIEELSAKFDTPLGAEIQTLNPSTGSGQAVERLTFDCASLGGLSLMERMLGSQRVVIVDSMETGQSPAGSVRVYKLEELPNPSAGHSASAHDTSLITALDTARAMGLLVPESVEIVAIEAKNVYDFSEELSPSVAEAVPLAAQSVINLLKMEEP